VVAEQPELVNAVTLGGHEMESTALLVTVTNCVHVSALPEASVAVQVTVVGPIGKAAGALLLTTGLAVQLSLAVTVPRFTPVAVQPLFVITETAGGHVMVGLTLSVTVTF
jgi:hypothetical protein